MEQVCFSCTQHSKVFRSRSWGIADLRVHEKLIEYLQCKIQKVWWWIEKMFNNSGPPYEQPCHWNCTFEYCLQGSNVVTVLLVNSCTQYTTWFCCLFFWSRARFSSYLPMQKDNVACAPLVWLGKRTIIWVLLVDYVVYRGNGGCIKAWQL